MEQNTPIPVDKQLKNLSQAAGQVRALIMPLRSSLPASTLEDLSRIESNLYQLSKDVAAFTEERKNLIALTEIGQVINSSLELDEVLMVVMDNIIKLTEAERGFLMLRDENGQMSTRVARN